VDGAARVPRKFRNAGSPTSQSSMLDTRVRYNVPYRVSKGV